MSRSQRSPWAATALGLPIALLLIAACAYSAWAASRFDVWKALFEAPRLLSSIGMTLWTGLASTLLAWGVSAWLLSLAWQQAWWGKLTQHLSFMLAVPHAAFAVGLVFLIAPSGWLIRAISPWLTDWQTPPQIATSQDAFGLGLIAMLVFKEVPFLLWAAATQLQRDDVRTRWPREAQAAQTLGYSATQAFWQVIWPQLSARLRWPLLAVLAYSLTVVDAALIAGPGSPSTLSVRAWQWLQEADDAAQATGAAAGWLLTALVALCAAGVWFSPAIKRLLHHMLLNETRIEGIRSSAPDKASSVLPQLAWWSFASVYIAVLLALLVGSVSGLWPFPQMLPQTLSLEAWQSVLRSQQTVWLTLALGTGSSAFALIWSVAWLESAPTKWDERLRRLLYLPVLLPGVLWVLGLHRLTLELQISGAWLGLALAHLLAVLPYTLITLSPAYLSFDARYGHISASLGKNRWSFLRQVKWPLLRQSLWATFAVGFAVSVAQFLPTLYIGEGRFLTVTTEAVTLSSGGQRSLVAAYAWLQGLLPAICFALAAWLGRPRRFS